MDVVEILRLAAAALQLVNEITRLLFHRRNLDKE